MLPLMQGPSPQGFATLAIAVALGACGALMATAAFLGWGALELICLIERYHDA